MEEFWTFDVFDDFSLNVSVHLLPIPILILMPAFTCSFTSTHFFFKRILCLFPKTALPFAVFSNSICSTNADVLISDKTTGIIHNTSRKEHCSEDVHTDTLIPSFLPLLLSLTFGLGCFSYFILIILLSVSFIFYAYFCSSYFALSIVRRLICRSSDIKKQCNEKSLFRTKMSFYKTIEPFIHS